MTSFKWEGTPVPKARPRMGANGNVYTPKRTQEFEDAMGWCWRMSAGAAIQGDVIVTIDVYEPAGHPADLDNYVKAILDGLNGLAFGDDKQVTCIAASVWRGHDQPGVQVTVEEALGA